MTAAPAPADVAATADFDHASHGRAARRATRATLLGRAALTLVAVGAVPVLARLVPPDAFGLLAMGTVLTALAASINDFNLPTAVVQAPRFGAASRRRLTRWHGRHNLRVTGLLLLSTPVLVLAFGEPVLWGLVPCLALGTWAQGRAAIATGVLRRRLWFGRLLGWQVVAQAVAAGAAITLAFRGFELTALAVQLILGQVLTAIGLCLLARSGPQERIVDTAASTEHRETEAEAEADVTLRKLGGHLTWAKAVRLLARRVDQILVGSLLGPAALGLYQQAYKWAWFPQKQLTGPLAMVNVADLSRVREHPEAYRRRTAAAVGKVYGLLLPTLCGLALEADRAVRVLLGEQWAAAADVFRVLLVFVACYTPLQVLKQVYGTEGRGAAFLRWSAVEAGVLVLAAGLGAGAGVLISRGAMANPLTVLALAMGCGAALLAYVGTRRCVRGSVLETRHLLGPALPPLLACLPAAAATWAAVPGFDPSETATLALTRAATAAAVFLPTYGLSWWAIRGLRRHTVEAAV